MSVWDIYSSRAQSIGIDKRERFLLRERSMLRDKMSETLSFNELTIDGVSQNLSVINTDNLNEKLIYALPGEDIKCGGLVQWMNNRWLVTEKDANTTIYTRAKMVQCNHLLKWVSDDHIIQEQWCIVEDGTKYLTGEYEDRNFVTTRGDTRIAIIVPRTELTSRFDRGCRFIIDDPNSKTKLAYNLSKPFKLGGVYNDTGVFKFVLQEVSVTEFDNQELGIADYYKHFPKDDDIPSSKEVWI